MPFCLQQRRQRVLNQPQKERAPLLSSPLHPPRQPLHTKPNPSLFLSPNPQSKALLPFSIDKPHVLVFRCPKHKASPPPHNKLVCCCKRAQRKRERQSSPHTTHPTPPHTRHAADARAPRRRRHAVPGAACLAPPGRLGRRPAAKVGGEFCLGRPSGPTFVFCGRWWGSDNTQRAPLSLGASSRFMPRRVVRAG